MRIKTSDHIRRRGNIRGCASLKSMAGVASPLWDEARRDQADRGLARRRMKRLVDLGRILRFPLETRACPCVGLPVQGASRDAANKPAL